MATAWGQPCVSNARARFRPRRRLPPSQVNPWSCVSPGRSHGRRSPFSRRAVAWRRLDGLRVEYEEVRVSAAALPATMTVQQRLEEGLELPRITPPAKLIIAAGPVREAVREGTPLTAGGEGIEECVDLWTQGVDARTSTPMCLRFYERTEKCPLGIAEIGRIGHDFSLLAHPD
jgi:hypothetical protein